MHMRALRRRNLAPWLEYVIPQHIKTLESLELDMIDHNEKDILEKCLTALFHNNSKLEHLSVTAFLTRNFADQLMSAIEMKLLPLKTVFIKAYSFEADADFIRDVLYRFAKQITSVS